MPSNIIDRLWCTRFWRKSVKARLVLYVSICCVCLSCTIAMVHQLLLLFTTNVQQKVPAVLLPLSRSNGPSTQRQFYHYYYNTITTTAHPCSSDKPSWKNLKPEMHFRSQSGEDQHLLEHFFHGLCNGTYVELGGLDGITISNSHVFSFIYDWKGVLIELAPGNYQKLVQNRPRELVTPIQAAICNSEQTVHYIDVENGKFWGTTAGIWEFMAESFRQTWWKNVQLADTIAIRCTPLRQLFREYTPNIHWFDFLSRFYGLFFDLTIP